MTCGLN